MELSINDDKTFDDPSADVLQAELPKLGVDQFAVLHCADEQYIQFYRHAEGYQLEYRDGSADKHFEIGEEGVSINDIVAAFVGYLEGDENRWKNNYPWVRLELGGDFDETHYELCGQEYARIRIGEEAKSVVDADGECPVCAREDGEYHEEGCPKEECPRCHDLLAECDCE